MELNHLAPFSTINGTFACVSTLFMQVGLAQTPRSVERTSFGRGMPRRPSIDDIIADDSPAAYDPAPTRISRLNENVEPRMFLPITPAVFASSIAFLTRLIARRCSPPS